MDYLIFLQKIRELRIKNGFSQRNLAKAMGKSAQYISMIENNKTPMKMKDYFKYCDILKVSPYILLENNLIAKESHLIEKRLRALSPRDFYIIKDLIMLMELNPSDL